MEDTKTKIQKAFDLIGFENIKVELDEAVKKIAVSIKDRSIAPGKIPALVQSLTHLARQIAKKDGEDYVLVDVNDYRKDREALIIKLARAAAKKAAVTKSPVPLPPMNSYERRIVHSELAVRPDVATESEGEANNRHVIIRATNL